MEHEELLSKITKMATVGFHELELERTWDRLCKFPNSVIAVVNRHSPNKELGTCNECFDEKYPCPTIKDIHKELA